MASTPNGAVMTEPRRIAAGDDFRASLLRAAKEDVVPRRAKARALAAIGAGATALGTKAAIAATTLKLAVIMIAAAGAVGVSRHLVNEARERQRVETRAPIVASQTPPAKTTLPEKRAAEED